MKSAQTKKTVINIDRSWEAPSPKNFWSLGVVAILILVLAGAAFLVYWSKSGESVMAQFEPEIRGLNQELDFYKDKNEELEVDLAKAQRASAVDAEASQELQKTIIDRENEIRVLKEELSFYKSIVNPEAGQKGLGIKEFTLEDTKVANRYKFLLVATQSSGKREVQGKVVIRLQGHKDADPVTLKWTEFSGSVKKAPSFKFQYFQKLEGLFILPEGFDPEHVLVKLEPRGGKVEKVQQSYSWQSLFKGIEKP